MRTALTLAAALMLLAAPALAGDNHVPQSTLAAVGLGEMQVLDDAQGHEVRGMSSNALAMGLSLVSGLIVDPASKSFVFGSDVNAAMATAENAGLNPFTTAQTNQLSTINLNLIVLPSATHPGFNGFIVGAAGGNAFASGL